jgi:hypothetical protein
MKTVGELIDEPALGKEKELKLLSEISDTLEQILEAIEQQSILLKQILEGVKKL